MKPKDMPQPLERATPLHLSMPAPKLDRKTKITKIENKTVSEHTVIFDELETVLELGRGSFGNVSKMHDRSSKLNFAVKMIKRPDNENEKVMDYEAYRMLGNGCQYIVKFYGALDAEGHIWILTELMDMDLQCFYKKMFTIQSAMPESLLSKTAHAVLSALNAMGEKQLMHRDIKPSNILINAACEIKVCDLGISGQMVNSRCMSPKGCEIYMPPEKVDRSLKGTGYSVKADIWSLGISLVEISTGSHPFENIFSVLSSKPVSFGDKTFSPQFHSFVDKCLTRNADERPNCTDLLNEEFIKKYSAQSLDLEWIRTVLALP